MVYLFMGPSCSGKSTVAKAFQNQLSLTIYEGKDYLRLAKNQGQAYACFSDILLKASESEASHVIYVITEPKELERLPQDASMKKVRFTAEVDHIKDRFKKRMHGQLPPPVEKMIQKQMESFQDLRADLVLNTSEETPEVMVEKLLQL